MCEVALVWANVVDDPRIEASACGCDAGQVLSQVRKEARRLVRSWMFLHRWLMGTL